MHFITDMYFMTTLHVLMQVLRLHLWVLREHNEAFVLTLPWKHLNISWLINKKKKFRSRGSQEAAMYAMKQLAEQKSGEGLEYCSSNLLLESRFSCNHCKIWEQEGFYKETERETERT